MKASRFQHEVRNTSQILGRNSDIKVTFEGDQAMTDGKRVVLPALPSGAEIDDELVGVIRGYIDHEAIGHFGFVAAIVKIEHRRFLVQMSPDSMPRQCANDAVATTPGDILHRFTDLVEALTGFRRLNACL